MQLSCQAHVHHTPAGKGMQTYRKSGASLHINICNPQWPIRHWQRGGWSAAHTLECKGLVLEMDGLVALLK